MDEGYTTVQLTGTEDFGGHKPSARPATKTPSCKPPKHPFRPQACQLCNQLTVYQTRSGLSDHATIHHSSWYSACEDIFVPIPEVNLVAKHQQVHEGQAHKCHCTDPIDAEQAVQAGFKEELLLKPSLKS